MMFLNESKMRLMLVYMSVTRMILVKPTLFLALLLNKGTFKWAIPGYLLICFKKLKKFIGIN